MSGQRIYNDDGDQLMQIAKGMEKIAIVPAGDPRTVALDRRIRIQWGQHLLDDITRSRYRVVICGVNDDDNSHGILSEILRLVPTSQWTLASVTSYAKTFRSAVQLHSKEDREPYVLKFDLDRILVLALMRPQDRDHFTLEDIYRGFRTISKMLEGRMDRQPAASVSFLGAKSNRLVDHRGEEPSFEAVLKAMHAAGFEGDIYPAVQMWRNASVGVFATYPFPESLDRMRQGSS
ncbi:MAG: hypothetical protein SGJ11_17305 [Phycisphaerae bacterium]|nr:hypothetical protein [Phycisphaerae bacterium]